MNYNELVTNLKKGYELRYCYNNARERVYLYNDLEDEEIGNVPKPLFRMLNNDYEVKRVTYAIEGSEEIGWFNIVSKR